MGEEQLSSLVGGTGNRVGALKCHSSWKPKHLSPGFREVPVTVLGSKIFLFGNNQFTAIEIKWEKELLLVCLHC